MKMEAWQGSFILVLKHSIVIFANQPFLAILETWKLKVHKRIYSLNQQLVEEETGHTNSFTVFRLPFSLEKESGGITF